MKVIRDLNDIPPEFRDAYVTIGNFDGVHLGHVPILEKLVGGAHNENRKALVITFDPHPKRVLHPDIKPFYLLTSLEEKIKLLEDAGVDGLILIPFDLEFAKTTAEAFVNRILWDKLHIRKIFIGHDYTFGKNKAGNETFLFSRGKKLGFDVDVIHAIKLGDETVSSTRLRYAILNGNVKMASRLLGRPYNISGTVIPGKSRGAALGIPTANIKPDKELLPAQGVYAVAVDLRGERYQGVLNIGFNPTFSDSELSVEVFLLNFNGDIYGEKLNIFFIERIRDEIKFDKPEQLVAQIKKDIDQAKTILKTIETSP
ncbi:MAG TPA: bifunctional riboflavin kinase/FAD synthetase [Syntrophales bacterium]|nr:bifunctional riboflavin kinase/FAD synthetase [Syntrophales bacterium]